MWKREHNLYQNYLIFECNEEINLFQFNMVNEISDNILKIEKIDNGLRYEILNYENLENILLNKDILYTDILDYISNILNICETISNYLLDYKNLVFENDKIFINYENIYLIYLPIDNKNSETLNLWIYNLVSRYIMLKKNEKIDDIEKLYYYTNQLLNYCNDEYFCIDGIKNIIKNIKSLINKDICFSKSNIIVENNIKEKYVDELFFKYENDKNIGDKKLNKESLYNSEKSSHDLTYFKFNNKEIILILFLMGIFFIISGYFLYRILNIYSKNTIELIKLLSILLFVLYLYLSYKIIIWFKNYKNKKTLEVDKKSLILNKEDEKIINNENDFNILEDKSIRLEEQNFFKNNDNVKNNVEKNLYSKFKDKEILNVTQRINVDFLAETSVLLNYESKKFYLLDTMTAEKIYLNKLEINVGRSDKNDIVIDENSVGRKHAVFLKKEDDYFIKDLKSLNGTFINNDKLKNKNEYLLKNEDLIKFANREYKFFISN